MKIRNCSSCGSSVNQGDKFCKVCGTEIISQMIQQNSLTENNSNTTKVESGI